MKDDVITRIHEDVVEESKNSDGVYQIANSLYIVIFTFLNLIGIGGGAIVYFIIIPLLVKYLRKKYTYPRIGYAKLKINDRWGITWSQFIYAVLAFGIFSYYMLTTTEVFPNISNKMFFPAILVIYISGIIYSILYYKKKRKLNLVWFLSGRDELKFCLWINKTPDQPDACHPVNTDVFPC